MALYSRSSALIVNGIFAHPEPVLDRMACSYLLTREQLVTFFQRYRPLPSAEPSVRGYLDALALERATQQGNEFFGVGIVNNHILANWPDHMGPLHVMGNSRSGLYGGL